MIHPFRWPSHLSTSLILIFNLIIILGAAYFGARGVIIFGVIGLLALLLHLAVSGFTMLAPLLLISTACIFYIYSSRVGRLLRNTQVELDDIEEESNILSVELKHSGLQTSALKQKLLRYTTLKGLTETLSSTLSFERVISLITSEALRIIGKSQDSLLYLVDREKQKLRIVSTKSKEVPLEARFKNGDIYDRWVFKQRTPLLVEDTQKDFRFNIQEPEGRLPNVRSLICAPLISGEKFLGILRLDNISPRGYDADDLRLLSIIADLSAVATVNTLLYKETERLAITDGLTGLFLHRYFHQRFGEEISRALWTDSCFAFLMLDIDNFKNYNDKYGHIAGDIILRKIAKLVSSSVNPGDIVARYGGEEFGVLLVDTPKSDALKIAEGIREKLEKKEFILRREPTRVSVSGGIALFPDDGKIKENIIQKADQALYKAKREGKNRICTC